MKTTMVPMSYLDHPKPTIGAELLTQCMYIQFIGDDRQLQPFSKVVYKWINRESLLMFQDDIEEE